MTTTYIIEFFGDEVCTINTLKIIPDPVDHDILHAVGVEYFPKQHNIVIEKDQEKAKLLEEIEKSKSQFPELWF